jgi:NADH-quinone oxidoreductase subunit G
MPVITIDGQKIEVANGKTIIQAAYDSGMQVPHFCWHPSLTVAGNCRMCLVEVGSPKRTQTGEIETDSNGNPLISYIPKLQIACATPVADGMVVHTNNAKATEAQEAVMEFLLINHPLDCPICDEAGECKLQEYAFRHSKGESRFDEMKNHKPKRQVWGPNVVFDAERCISCSRCIRFAQEVAKQDVLTFVQRGDHVTIQLFDNTVFDNNYSMNVIELCPVGALTSSDFRFKARVWDMSFNPSISFADASGTNTELGIRNNEILRVQPRTNPYVNEFWMTDDARLEHIDFVNNNRVIEPLIKSDGLQVAATWDEATDYFATRLKEFNAEEIFILSSGKATNESNYLLGLFAKEILKTNNIDAKQHLDESKNDGFLSVADRTPNYTGAKELAVAQNGTLYSNLKSRIESGEIKALYVVEESAEALSELTSVLDKLSFLAVNAYNNDELTAKADVVLPCSTYAEQDGTYTNYKGRVQQIRAALVTKENLRYMGMRMSRLDKFGAFNDRWTQHELRNCRPTWRIIKDLAKRFGSDWKLGSSEDVFRLIEKNVPSFSGMTYDLLNEYQGLVLNKALEPDPKVTNYVSHVMRPH